MLNRRISMNMLLKIAKEQVYRQFILLTPQDMSYVSGSDRVRIFKLNDPERGQQTLPYEAEWKWDCTHQNLVTSCILYKISGNIVRAFYWICSIPRTTSIPMRCKNGWKNLFIFATPVPLIPPNNQPASSRPYSIFLLLYIAEQFLFCLLISFSFLEKIFLCTSSKSWSIFSYSRIMIQK